MKRCLIPLVKLTDCDGRLVLDLGGCGPCGPEITQLLLEKAGCVEYEEVVELKACENRSFGCCSPCVPTPHLKIVEKAKPSIVYPLHEIDCNGSAVFVIDGKLATLGYGRYSAKVLSGGREVLRFDVEYTQDNPSLMGIHTEQNVAMGGRC